MSRTATLVLAAALVMHAEVMAGPVIDDSKFSFRVTLPDGFVPVPEKVTGKVIHAYTRPAIEGRPAIWILVQRMGGTIGRDKLGPPPASGPAVTVFTERWKSFDLEVIRLPESADGVDYLTLNTQVPLAGEAIQLLVAGPKTEEPEQRSINRSLLLSLDGKSNWLSNEDRIGKVIVGGLTLLTLVGGTVALVLFGMRQSKARKRHLREREWERERERDARDRERPRRANRRRPVDSDSDSDAGRG